MPTEDVTLHDLSTSINSNGYVEPGDFNEQAVYDRCQELAQHGDANFQITYETDPGNPHVRALIAITHMSGGGTEVFRTTEDLHDILPQELPAPPPPDWPAYMDDAVPGQGGHYAETPYQTMTPDELGAIDGRGHSEAVSWQESDTRGRGAAVAGGPAGPVPASFAALMQDAQWWNVYVQFAQVSYQTENVEFMNDVYAYQGDPTWDRFDSMIAKYLVTSPINIDNAVYNALVAIHQNADLRQQPSPGKNAFDAAYTQIYKLLQANYSTFTGWYARQLPAPATTSPSATA